MAVVDTNCSPEGIDYVIPGNDDALRAVRLFASRIADAVLEGQQIATEGGVAAQAEQDQAAAGEDLEAAGKVSEPAPKGASDTAATVGTAEAPQSPAANNGSVVEQAAAPSAASETAEADEAAGESAESVVAAS